MQTIWPNRRHGIWLALCGLLVMVSCGRPPQPISEPVQPTPEPTPTTSTPTNMVQLLAMHNQARNAVGVLPLKWSATLAASAQAWANTAPDNDGDGLIDHSTSSPYGENIYGSTGSADPTAAATMWLGEIADYTYATNSCKTGKMCGHYTQAVWKSTTEVGCATANRSGIEYGYTVLCHYNPPGNYLGQKPY